MKLDEDMLFERNKISKGSLLPLQHMPLLPFDVVMHRNELEKVYKGMLHEAGVIDDCCRRFEKTFEEKRFLIIE